METLNSYLNNVLPGISSSRVNLSAQLFNWEQRLKLKGTRFESCDKNWIMTAGMGYVFS